MAHATHAARNKIINTLSMPKAISLTERLHLEHHFQLVCSLHVGHVLPSILHHSAVHIQYLPKVGKAEKTTPCTVVIPGKGLEGSRGPHCQLQGRGWGQHNILWGDTVEDGLTWGGGGGVGQRSSWEEWREGGLIDKLELCHRERVNTMCSGAWLTQPQTSDKYCSSSCNMMV